MRFLLIITIAIAVFSCKKERYEGDGFYSVDASFEPTTTSVNILTESIDEICIYENNYLFARTDSISTVKNSWYLEDDDGRIFLSNNYSQLLTRSGKYYFKSEGYNGTNKVDTVINFSIQYCPSYVIFPDAFKPDGDGEFDFWAPVTEGISELEYSVLDTRGNVLFEVRTEMIESVVEWNGMYKGKRSPAGTYNYRAKGSLKSGYKFEYSGTFELIR